MRYALSSGSAGTQQALTTTPKTLASLTAATGATTLRRARIYDLMVGADGTPADNVLVFKVDRQTTVGTGTAATPTPLDPGDAAALITGNVNSTIEPTVTANSQLLEIPVNQRASYRWVAAPGGELIVPAINTNGIGVRARSPAYTGTAMVALNYEE